MGRKKKDVDADIVKNTEATENAKVTENMIAEVNKNAVRDRIGETVDLDKCPACTAHTDCFGNINGKCTALNDCGECSGQGCAFYKPYDVAVEQNKAAYKKLVKAHRYDLIYKYGKQLAALGAMDDDDDEAMDESIEGSGDFKAYEAMDYQKQLEKMNKMTTATKAVEATKKAGEDAQV